MQEKDSARKKTVVVDVSLIRELVVILCCILSTVALLAYLALTGARAVASEVETAQAASTGMRQFYLTTSGFQGNGVLTACVTGYHFASLWEMVDPSNLKYNTSLGLTEDDSGQGPPAQWYGWVRTGYASDESNTTGQTNCLLWTSLSNKGTTAALPNDWTAGGQNMGVWQTLSGSCSLSLPVWCIED